MFVCFKLLLPCPQIGNNVWEWSYGKHDAGIYWVEYCFGGNYIRRSFLDCNNPGGNFLGGNFPGGSYRGWEFSRWELSWVGIVRVGVILGGNCQAGSYPGCEFSLVVVFRVGIVRGESSGWEFSGWEFSQYAKCLGVPFWYTLFFISIKLKHT